MNGIIAAAFTISYLFISILRCRRYKLQIKDLTMCAIACALTIVLSYFYIPLPTGATVSLGSCIPILILAMVFDGQLAMIAGWAAGFLCLFLVPSWQPVHWAQFFTEHMICFSCLGYVTIFGTQSKIRIYAGMLTAFGLKLAAHILSGVVFYSTNAWDGWGAWVYSLSYNVSFWLPEMILTALILHFVPWKSLKMALRK